MVVRLWVIFYCFFVKEILLLIALTGYETEISILKIVSYKVEILIKTLYIVNYISATEP